MATTRGRLALSYLTAALAAGALTAAVPLQKAMDATAGTSQTQAGVSVDFMRFGTTPEQRTIPEVINGQDRVTLYGNVHAALRDAEELGPTDPQLPMEKMILTLKMAPDAKYRLDQLLAAQQDPTSPYFRKWLTPDQFGQMFGPSQADLQAVTTWLQGKGFKVEGIAPGRLTINFSGSVAQVQHAFQTSIQDYKIHGVNRHANANDPSIPAALSDVVAGVVSLNNIPRHALNTGIHTLSTQEAAGVRARLLGIVANWSGTANGTSGVYLSPTDWAKIYDANASYTANGTGTGVVIGIVGRTNPGTANWATFRSTLGLPVNTPTIIVNGTNPGDLGAGEDGEADLDAEWSGGVAPGATVKFVASASTSSTDGVDLSAQYIVNNNLADVMSTSFGQAEATMGSTENAFYNNLWSQAASQGITACVSTGDSGAAGANAGSDTSGSGGYAVNGLASTPYNVAVGATQLSTSSSYWSNGSPTGYIPETPWNESGTVSGGSGLWSTSSGASSIYAKPSWQVAPGVPATSHRYMPDVCLDGSDMFFGNYGMLVYSQGAMATTGGTSAASPSFAGVMALVVQKYGRQGNANTKLYQLGNAQYSSAGTAVFHDITSGNNNVPGLTGFTAAAGWDEVTGLGTPDVNALVNNWNGTVTPPNTVTASITTPAGNVTIASGATLAFAGSATDSSTSATFTYGWNFGDGTTATGATASHTFTNTGTTAVTRTVTFTATDNTGVANSATRTVTVNPPAANTVTASITTPSGNVTLASGATQSFAGSATDSSTTATLTYGWNFGDGSTATGATASHTFTNTGTTAVTRTVTFTATDNTGVASSATRTVTVNPATTTASQILLNPGFESGSASWAQTSGVIGQYGSQGEPTHGGTWDAWLDGYGSTHTDTLSQSVAIPSTASSATLNFYLHIDTAETTTTSAYDKLTLVVKSGTTTTTLATFSNLNAASGYTLHSYDLSAFKGKTVTILFTGTEDSSLQTSFVVDDTSLNIQ